MDESTKKALLGKLFQSFKNGLMAPKAQIPRAYLEKLGLDGMKLGLGFNSGQFHHRASMEFKKVHEELGMLRLNEKVGANKEGRIPYTCFGGYSIVYPLRDEWGEIVNFYAYRFKLETPIGNYLYPDQGIYPSYPKPTTKQLFLTDNILETASLLQSDLLTKGQSVIALFEGKLTEGIHDLLLERSSIEKIIVLSRNPNKQVYTELTKTYPSKEIQLIQLETKSVHDFLLTSSIVDLEDLLQAKTSEILSEKKNTKAELKIINPQKLSFEGAEGRYEIVGKLSLDLGQLRVSLRIIHRETLKVYRTKIDLFDSSDINHRVNQLSVDFNSSVLEADLYQLTEVLENYRDSLFKQQLDEHTKENKDEHYTELTPIAQEQAMDFLTQKGLMSRIDRLIETSGIIGEQSSRKTAFIIASSYKMPYSLHGLIQGSSGNGKSHLINKVAELIPTEDVISLSRITSRSLYNYQNDELMYKLILIQDEDGFDEESLYAFRELQSAGFLNSSTSSKNSFGKHQSKVTRVRAHFSSLMASTKTEIYTDNESRSIVLGIDESDEQTRRIIRYTNELRAGLIEKPVQKKAKLLVRNCIRLLKRKEVINPFAHKIELPIEAKMLRRLNGQFQDFICQITLLNQFQREEDQSGRVIATKEDIAQGIDIFFSSIMFKIDELDSSSRQLFDRLKAHVLQKPKREKHVFSRKEIREALNLKKTRTAQLVQLLLELEYIVISSGSSNRGFNYLIEQWDDGLNKLKTRIRSDLQNQLKALPDS